MSPRTAPPGQHWPPPVPIPPVPGRWPRPLPSEGQNLMRILAATAALLALAGTITGQSIRR